MADKRKLYDVVIIGAGPAGLSSGLFAGLYGLKTLIVGEIIGGQANNAPMIFDYPGVKEIPGKDLISILLDQLKEMGVEWREEKVVEIRNGMSDKESGIKNRRNTSEVKRKSQVFTVSTEIKEYFSQSIIFATGNHRRRPDYSGTKLAKNIGVKMDDKGFIKTNFKLATSVTGIFAAGDCMTYPRSLEQISVASSLGIRAAASVYSFIKGGKPPVLWGKARIRRIES